MLLITVFFLLDFSPLDNYYIYIKFNYKRSMFLYFEFYFYRISNFYKYTFLIIFSSSTRFLSNSKSLNVVKLLSEKWNIDKIFYKSLFSFIRKY